MPLGGVLHAALGSILADVVLVLVISKVGRCERRSAAHASRFFREHIAYSGWIAEKVAYVLDIVIAPHRSAVRVRYVVC